MSTSNNSCTDRNDEANNSKKLEASVSNSLIQPRDQKTFDDLDIRLGSPFEWKHDLPELLTSRRFHQSVAIRDKSNGSYNLVILGGFKDVHLQIKSVESFRLGEGKTSIPDMNFERLNFGADVCGQKLYAIGGHNQVGGGNTFEVLDLDNLHAGWTLHNLPPLLEHATYFKAVAIDNRYIYVFCAWIANPGRNTFCSYDTKLFTWDMSPKPSRYRTDGFSMVSIFIPGEGSYVVVLGGSQPDHSATIDAFHVEKQTWIHLPDIPIGRSYSMVSTIGNRYIIVSGGFSNLDSRSISSVFTLDWKNKVWMEFPPLPVARGCGTGMYVPGAINKFIITGRYLREGFVESPSVSLDIAPGIGWAKEKLLLLCFRGKAQRKGSQKLCPLEGLESGIFATILSYLIAPFAHEVNCKGSIFASVVNGSESLPSISCVVSGKRKAVSGKRKASSLVGSDAQNRRKI